MSTAAQPVTPAGLDLVPLLGLPARATVGVDGDLRTLVADLKGAGHRSGTCLSGGPACDALVVAGWRGFGGRPSELSPDDVLALLVEWSATSPARRAVREADLRTARLLGLDACTLRRSP